MQNPARGSYGLFARPAPEFAGAVGVQERDGSRLWRGVKVGEAAVPSAAAGEEAGEEAGEREASAAVMIPVGSVLGEYVGEASPPAPPPTFPVGFPTGALPWLGSHGEQPLRADPEDLGDGAHWAGEGGGVRLPMR
jgi:hypothetical protein